MGKSGKEWERVRFMGKSRMQEKVLFYARIHTRKRIGQESVGKELGKSWERVGKECLVNVLQMSCKYFANALQIFLQLSSISFRRCNL